MKKRILIIVLVVIAIIVGLTIYDARTILKGGVTQGTGKIVR